MWGTKVLPTLAQRLSTPCTTKLFRGGGPEPTLMQYRTPFPEVTEDCPVPNKLISKVEEVYNDLLYIDIVRVEAATTKTVNQIKLSRAAEGHPDEEVLTICEAVMQAVLYSASEEGITTYRALIFVKDSGGGRPQKRLVTINRKELALFMEEGSEGPSKHDSESNSVTEEAFAMVKEVMSLNTSFHTEALNGMLEQNRELHDRLLEHSRNATMGNENMQKLLGSMTDQLREAGVAKDRALSILHATRVAEIDAEAKKARNEMLTDMLRPAFMILASQLGDKFGISPSVLMTEDERETQRSEDAVKMAEAQAQANGTGDDEAGTAAVAEEIKKRLETEPTLVYLEMLKESLTAEQWLGLDKIRPAALITMLKAAFEITDEDKAADAMKEIGGVLFGEESLQQQIGAVLNEDQSTIVKAMFTAVTEKGMKG
jgi:hypothetical protein